MLAVWVRTGPDDKNDDLLKTRKQVADKKIANSIRRALPLASNPQD
jgi:hypothetical protein